MVDRATGVDAEGRRSQRATPAPESAPRLELLTNFPPLPIIVPFHPKNKIQKGKGFARVAWGRFSLISSSHLSRSSATLHLFIVRDQEENSMTPPFDHRFIRGKIAPFLIGREWRLYEYVTRGNLGWDETLIRSKVKFSFENCLLIQIYIPEIERFRD